MEEALKDERFSHILTDPRFRKMPKNIQKVTVDKRFEGMFKDKKFKGKGIFDKRGRSLDLKPSENLKQLYDISSESSEADDGEDEQMLRKQAEVKQVENSVSSNEDSDKDSSEESDDSDDSDEDNGDISDDFDHQWEELRNEAPDTKEITRRIAVCNMDWDRIRVDDLFACFNSFKPADGTVTSVKIYPSEFGLKRIEEERVRGPSELVEETFPLNKDEPKDKKGSKYHREKLRQYQINRLKYFYAVVDCDSPETANTLYEQLNGMEYESSSVRFDLRFIPDDVTFEHEPTSIADKVPDPTEYKPRLFVTAALQQVKVNLTWDETDPKRRETLQKAFTEPKSIEKDIKEYLASSSGESEEDEEKGVEEPSKQKLSVKDRVAKYKELLLSIEEKEKEEENKYEMEITWDTGLKDKTEEIVKEKMKKDNLNYFEESIQKKKDERKLKKKGQKSKQMQTYEDSASSDEDNDGEFFLRSTSESKVKYQDSKRLAELALISDSRKETNFVEKPNKKSKKFRKNEPESTSELKVKDQESKRLAELALISDSRKETNFIEKPNKKSKKFKKNKPQKEDDIKIDVNDPRFSAIYSSHLYNIDPSHPNFKDSEGNRALIQEKQRRLKLAGHQGNNKNTKKARYF